MHEVWRAHAWTSSFIKLFKYNSDYVAYLIHIPDLILYEYLCCLQFAHSSYCPLPDSFCKVITSKYLHTDLSRDKDVTMAGHLADLTGWWECHHCKREVQPAWKKECPDCRHKQCSDCKLLGPPLPSPTPSPSPPPAPPSLAATSHSSSSCPLDYQSNYQHVNSANGHRLSSTGRRYCCACGGLNNPAASGWQCPVDRHAFCYDRCFDYA